jgi:hypothetical protein
LEEQTLHQRDQQATAKAIDPFFETPVRESDAEDVQEELTYDPSTAATVLRFMQERDAILEQIEPNLKPMSQETHASISVLSGWADRMIDDEYLQAYMQRYRGCPICEENFAYYKARREEI